MAGGACVHRRDQGQAAIQATMKRTLRHAVRQTKARHLLQLGVPFNRHALWPGVAADGARSGTHLRLWCQPLHQTHMPTGPRPAQRSACCLAAYGKAVHTRACR